MFRQPPSFPDLLEKIPPPTVIRERLSGALREVRFLRQLLRLAEHTAKDRERLDAGKERATR
jgi:hypothetical protein